MIRLDTTTRSLEAVLGGAVSTNQLPITVSYSDKTSSAYTGATQLTNTNSGTAVTIASAPAASTVRDVDYISVRNSDTAEATVTIRYNDNTTLYTVITAALAIGDQLIYTHGGGWETLDANGNRKSISANSQPLDATLTSIAALGTGADKYLYTTGVDTWVEGDITTAGRALLDDANAAAQRTTLGLAIGTDVQAYDATLQSLSSLGTAADRYAYTTGIDTWAEGTITAAGRAILDDSDAATQRTTLGLAIGTNVQAYDATLQSLSSLGTAADKYAYTTGVDTWAEGDITAAGRALLDDADADTQLGTLGGTTVGKAVFKAATAASARLTLVVSGHGYISGLICSNNSGDANNDIDISAGECIDSTNASILVGSAMTKRLDAAWAAGTNQGGIDTGSKASSTEYYIHAILKDSDNSVDYLFSASRTAPTMPAGYTKFRHIGWCKTDGSSNILGFIATETAGGGLNFLWKTPVNDVSLASTLTTAARTDALSVMTGVKVRPHATARTYDASSGHSVIYTDPDTTDIASGGGTLSTITASGHAVANLASIMTNTSRQIRARSDLATVDDYYVTTFGFEWSRR